MGGEDTLAFVYKNISGEINRGVLDTPHASSWQLFEPHINSMSTILEVRETEAEQG